MNNIVVFEFIGVLLFLWIIISISQIRSDIARMNATINKIAYKEGVFDTLRDELKSLISQDKSIEAIKRYRMITGAGLLEAKEYVDSLTEQETLK